jgi:hypothetical protein
MKERYDVRFDGFRLQADTLEYAKKIKTELETWKTDAAGNRYRYHATIVDRLTNQEIDE